jgi:hypothetical protein
LLRAVSNPIAIAETAEKFQLDPDAKHLSSNHISRKHDIASEARSDVGPLSLRIRSLGRERETINQYHGTTTVLCTSVCHVRST